MDLSVFLDDIKLNIRSAVIIETEKGYIFDKDRLDGYYYVVGGRIKINETSENAARREIDEEIGIKIENIKLKAIVESFFVLDNRGCHEICFYYRHKTDGEIKLPENYYVFNEEEIIIKEIRPKIISDIINSKNNDILHIILNE